MKYVSTIALSMLTLATEPTLKHTEKYQANPVKQKITIAVPLDKVVLEESKKIAQDCSGNGKKISYDCLAFFIRPDDEKMQRICDEKLPGSKLGHKQKTIFYKEPETRFACIK